MMPRYFYMITQIDMKCCVSLYCCQELDKLRTENKDMRTDMLKMAKQHQKLQHKLKDLVEFEKTKKLLEAMAFYVCTCHYCSYLHISLRKVQGWSNILFQELLSELIYNFTYLHDCTYPRGGMRSSFLYNFTQL